MSHDKKTELGKIRLKHQAVDSSSSPEAQQAELQNLNKKLNELGSRTGVAPVNIEALQIDLQVLDILPREIAEQHVILPIDISGDALRLAMAAPEDAKVIDEIEFVSGKNVVPAVAIRTQLISLIDLCYNAKEAGEKQFTGVYYGMTPATPQQSPDAPAATRPSSPAKASAVETDFGLDLEMDFPMEEQLPSMEMLSGIEDEPEPELEVAKKILVVDDEDDIRLLISRVLTEKGYDVVTAGRGLEAVQMVQNEEPDMIILDAMLPEVHGFDICRKIKGSKKYGHIPVIMISAIYRGWRYAQDLKDSYGVDDFIEKPFKLQEFLEKVEKLLSAENSEFVEAQEDLTKKTEEILSQSIKAYKTGKIEVAIELLKKGLEIDPLAYKLHYNLALLLGKKSLNYQAIRELESTLELEPNYFPAMKNLALLYQKAGFKFKAIETWERSLHYCPDDETRNSIKQHLMDIL
ncbi:MAG: response regulator [Deltaproteobacteria bacterium]|nr:response regulator [Deltaproteobacteria bacterium]MBN2670557.1 response regulator [Deltaproteobacteria bacterium]